MDDFHEVARRLRRVNVTSQEYGNSHGVLSLAGDDSSVELTGNLPMGGAPPPGWFDLRLQDGSGRTIFIHNAVRMSMSFSSGRKVRSAVLFPNFVVDDASGLDMDGCCRRISFGLDGWLACFGYNYIEMLDVSGDHRDSLKATLEAARDDFLRDEPFEPHQVYVVNNFGTLAEFDVNDRHYSIFAGLRYSGGRNHLDEHVRLIGTITFPKPIDLDAAINACWDWRRYFNQMAMSVLAFTGMSVAAATEPTAPQGNLYLPNERPSRSRRSGHGSDAHHMPLNQWDERKAAREAMRSWLSCQEERRVFRAALDRVLARPGHVAIEDAVALCGGVETLSELSTRESLSTQALDSMATAAVRAAADADIQLDPTRVRGLLGSLQNDDLRRRLRRLAAIAAPEADQGVVEHWIGVILLLRQFGAHGRRPATDHDLVAGPAVDALAALCARYDLQGAGMPDQCSNDACSLPKFEWDQALMSLRMQQEARAK